MKKTILAAICAVLVVCAVMSLRGGRYTQTEYTMNTVITITADDKSAVSECFEEIRSVEALLSVHLPDSDIAAVNSAPAGVPTRVRRETFELLCKAVEYKALTDGAFDISVKPVADLWDVAGNGYVPTDAELSDALALVGDIVLDEEHLTVTLPVSGMSIDLGGIAKGYAGDRVRDILISHGVRSAIADLGGNIVVIGTNGRKPWRIGLQHPDKPHGSLLAEITAEDKSVVTSGGYERYFEKDGQTYHHIFDPVTGKNPDNGVRSVTVVSDDGTLADAMSTACYVMGTDKALALADKCGVDIIVYDTDGVHHTDGVTPENVR